MLKYSSFCIEQHSKFQLCFSWKCGEVLSHYWRTFSFRREMKFDEKRYCFAWWIISSRRLGVNKIIIKKEKCQASFTSVELRRYLLSYQQIDPLTSLQHGWGRKTTYSTRILKQQRGTAKLRIWLPHAPSKHHSLKMAGNGFSARGERKWAVSSGHYLVVVKGTSSEDDDDCHDNVVKKNTISRHCNKISPLFQVVRHGKCVSTLIARMKFVWTV